MTNCSDVCRLKRLNLKRLSEKRHNVFWKFSTRYTRHTCYTHKHSRTPYTPTSTLRDFRILDSFVILVDYFAVFGKI